MDDLLPLHCNSVDFIYYDLKQEGRKEEKKEVEFSLLKRTENSEMGSNGIREAGQDLNSISVPCIKPW